ncbi:protein-glutamate O-methyltransferase CheR [Poseidonocella sp. HB161398]|uniref:CheR family methyltransferase n=1 Tax=Poseidonocella sp. HB161398 TaxID=2320855 RepID=UPI0011095BF2|nr:protein-glutamate O-methyltransferase CheR [Poseidonocella sp. HB161398]
MKNIPAIAPALTAEQFRFVASVAHKEAGLVLVESKSSMIAARLSKRTKELKLPNLESYFKLLESEDGRNETIHLLSALTTNVSHFFREEHHFQTLADEIIPELKKKLESGTSVRIWSAGCSTGQEIYSIAITLHENLPNLQNYDLKLLATDIDPQVIEFAMQGVYSERQVSSIPKNILSKYFIQTEDGQMRLSREIMNHVTFRRLNLLSEWPMKSNFDAIFCRNVVIYFDEKTQNDLWGRFTKILKKDGWLFIGHSERIQEPGSYSLKTAGITTYRKL